MATKKATTTKKAAQPAKKKAAPNRAAKRTTKSGYSFLRARRFYETQDNELLGPLAVLCAVERESAVRPLVTQTHLMQFVKRKQPRRAGSSVGPTRHSVTKG